MPIFTSAELRSVGRQSRGRRLVRTLVHTETMSTIPKEKLDKLVGRWSAIQAELNAGVNQATRTPS